MKSAAMPTWSPSRPRKYRPRSYPETVKARALARVFAGESQRTVSLDLHVGRWTLWRWVEMVPKLMRPRLPGRAPARLPRRPMGLKTVPRARLRLDRPLWSTGKHHRLCDRCRQDVDIAED